MNIISSLEAFALKKYKPGKFFYTHKPDKDMTAIAHYYGRLIKTERMFAMDSEHKRIEKLTKVTIIK